MSKLGVVSAARRRQARRRPTVVPDAIEGQIVEICRDLEVQVKRMRQLQEQADELRAGIGAWASPSEPPDREPANRAGRR
jgi:transposase